MLYDLFIILLGLKIAGVTEISWWIVAAPFIVALVFELLWAWATQ